MDDDAIAAAAAVLQRGGLVAFPTETVYGLGADAANVAALRRLYAVKGRPPDHPVIVHIASARQLPEWAREVPPAAERLAEVFWPGPLTLVLPRSARVPDEVTGGLDTVGLRVPDHPVALRLLATFGGGVAAPSANRFGRVSPTTAEDVRADLGDDVDVVLDGGPCQVGVESTIVDLSRDPPALLRPGGVPVEDIANVLGVMPVPPTAAARAPGRLPSHYAPRCRIELIAPDQIAARVEELRANGLRAVGHVPADDLAAEARSLYRRLREADRDGVDVLVTALPPEHDLGRALADRLRRAAAPREPGGSGT